ncbi:MAG: flagellar biosynthesis anti-sigma factor FlgM [Clostridiales bacterium]|nr:flagellar biosynthesis anti-sigma factor FlgM [Clostridiales bacterium]
MKINPIAGQTAIRAYKTPRAGTHVNDFIQSMDQVSLSEEVVSFSSTISKIKEALDTHTPEELAHIEDISALIHNGSYHVESYNVASKIVDEYISVNK